LDDIPSQLGPLQQLRASADAGSWRASGAAAAVTSTAPTFAMKLRLAVLSYTWQAADSSHVSEALLAAFLLLLKGTRIPHLLT
jgi:hypothetical protein